MVKKFNNLTVLVSGLLAAVFYVGLSMVAYFHYPASFSIKENWISNLGNTNLNPGGAIYFRLAVVLTGIVLIILFLGLRYWRDKQNRKLKISALIAQFFGIIGSITFLLTGYFSEDNLAPHKFLTMTSFLTLGISVFWIGMGSLFYNRISKFFSAYAFLLVLVGIVYAFMIEVVWMEWLAQSMLSVFVAITGFVLSTQESSLVPQLKKKESLGE